MSHQRITTCYLGLGSNLGNLPHNLNQAIHHINKLRNTHIVASAPWYTSKAWGVTEQADFLNTVIEIQTGLTPLSLLHFIKKIEYQLMNRPVNAKWHSRNIDIDILLFGSQLIARPELIVPHPFIAQRCFVIEPLLFLKPQLPKHLAHQIHKHRKAHQCSADLVVKRTPYVHK